MLLAVGRMMLDPFFPWTDAQSIIYIDEPGSTALSRPTDDYFGTLQALLTTCREVVWSTRGAAMDVVDPQASLMQGIFRTL